MTGSLAVTWVDSLDDVPRSRWDGLAADGGLYLSHGWLRMQERGSSSSRSYALAAIGDRLVGALPVDIVERTANDYYTFRAVLPPGHPEPPEPVMLLGGRGGYAGGLLLDRSLDADGRRRTAHALLTDAVRASERAGRAAAFFYLQDSLRELVQETAAGGVPLLARHEAAVHLPGNGWADYLGGLSSMRRKSIRREERQFDAAGYSVTVGDLTPWLGAAGALLANVQRRYGHDNDPGEMAEVLAEQIADLGEHVAFLCADEHGLVGFALGFPFGATLSMRAAGFDYERLRGAAEYFNLAYYRPIRWAYEHGATRIHLGIGSLPAKSRRGARLAPLWVVPVGWTWADESSIQQANLERSEDPASW